MGGKPDRDTVHNGSVTNSNYRIYNNITVNGNYHLTASDEAQLKAMEQIDMQEAFNNDPGAEYRGYLAGETEGAYIYDKTGNLIWDQEEGVKITWTPYGKVRQVFSHNGENIVSFQYDATGNRIRKSVLSPDTTYTISYLRDGSGNVLGVYDQADVRSHYIYGSSRIGENTAYSRVKGQQSFGDRSYEISNHLGNVLAVLSDERHQVNDSIWSQVKSTTDYYPFGLEMKGRSVGDYRYGFNGKEKDPKEEWGGNSHYDYGFRVYNPEIGKFLSSDPLEKEYPWWTPYQFAANSPISALDNDGKRVYFVAGAGNDALGWNYVERFKRIFTRKGIKRFTRINASHDFRITLKWGLPPIGDIAFTANFRDSRFDTYPHPDVPGQTFTVKVSDRQILRTVNKIVEDLTNSPLAEGEQLNLSGYSYGSVLQAHVALELIERGYKVDNLILIGSPISDNSDLFNELKEQQAAGNIGQIIREDIPGDKLSNPSSLQEFFDGAEQNSSDAGPHFDLARPDDPSTTEVNEEEQANKRIEKLADKVKAKGVN